VSFRPDREALLERAVHYEQQAYTLASRLEALRTGSN